MAFVGLCRPCILVCIRSLRLSPMLLASSSVRPSTMLSQYMEALLLSHLKTWESRLSRSIKSALGPKKRLIENVQGSSSHTYLGNIGVWHFLSLVSSRQLLSKKCSFGEREYNFVSCRKDAEIGLTSFWTDRLSRDLCIDEKLF